MSASNPRTGARILAIERHPEFCRLRTAVSGESEQQRYRRELAALCRQFIRIGADEELEVVRDIMAYRVTHPNFAITTKTTVQRKRAGKRS